MTRALNRLFLVAVLYAALQVIVIAWVLPALLKEFV